MLLSLAILCSPSLQGILLHPWRCGQLDGATAAGDLKMGIGGGGRGRIDMRGRRRDATRMQRERERRGGGVTWNRRTTRASPTSSSSAAARAGRGGGAPAAAARRRSAAAAVRLGATAKGWSGVGATVNGLVWRYGRGGRGGFTLFIPKGAPGASYLAGHGAVTKFS